MLLLNCTDEIIMGRFSDTPPLVQNGQEILIPPRTYTFVPGDPQEVSDAAGEHLLAKLQRRGLIRFRLGDDLGDLRARGRRELYRHCCRQLDLFQQENGGRAAQGLPPLVAGEHLYEARRIKRLLEREITGDFAEEPIPAYAKAEPGGFDTLTDEQRRILNARRGANEDVDRARAAGTPLS